jgi:hypothetical protein
MLFFLMSLLIDIIFCDVLCSNRLWDNKTLTKRTTVLTATNGSACKSLTSFSIYKMKRCNTFKLQHGKHCKNLT